MTTLPPSEQGICIERERVGGVEREGAAGEWVSEWERGEWVSGWERVGDEERQRQREIERVCVFMCLRERERDYERLTLCACLAKVYSKSRLAQNRFSFST